MPWCRPHSDGKGAADGAPRALTPVYRPCMRLACPVVAVGCGTEQSARCRRIPVPCPASGPRPAPRLHDPQLNGAYGMTRNVLPARAMDRFGLQCLVARRSGVLAISDAAEASLQESCASAARAQTARVPDAQVTVAQVTVAQVPNAQVPDAQSAGRRKPERPPERAGATGRRRYAPGASRIKCTVSAQQVPEVASWIIRQYST